MKKLHFSYDMEIAFSQPVQNNYFTMKCIPRSSDRQSIYGYKFVAGATDELRSHEDLFGNLYYAGRIMAPQTEFSAHFEGYGWIRNVPVLEPLHSLFCFETDKTAMDDSLRAFYADHAGYGRDPEKMTERLMEALYYELTYDPGVTDVATSAKAAFSMRAGVCQDYAHILIALCRYGGVPARYIAGCMCGEGASHAWIEMYREGQWSGFDPTHNRRTDDTYITLSVGCDADDCVLNRGVFSGFATQVQSVSLKVCEV